MKLIQLGITLSNNKGELPNGTTTWQFNFLFDAKLYKLILFYVIFYLLYKLAQIVVIQNQLIF